MLWLFSRQYIGWMLLAWAFCALPATLLLREAGWEWRHSLVAALPLTAIHLINCTSAWFLAGFAPLRRASPWRAVAATSIAAVVAGALWVQIGYLYAAILSQTTTLGDLTGPLTALSSPLWAAGVLLYICASAIAFLDSERRDAQHAREAMLRGETLAREAELLALRAQLNPHFLFNALHSISALAGIDKDRARQTCALLGDFLRLSLGIGDRGLIPLAEELTLIDHYLRIEQVRYPQLGFHRDIDDAALTVPVPPLLLQPLVENAIRHGIATLGGPGDIDLHASATGNHLFIRLANVYDPDSPAPRGNGIGIENVRRRIRSLYGGGGRLDVFRQNGKFRAEIYLLKQVPEVPA
ncbi:MAG: histidine kinase [Bryobacterales bacterium]|nr:histidine kinase [Bryobacterales bacterium]